MYIDKNKVLTVSGIVVLALSGSLFLSTNALAAPKAAAPKSLQHRYYPDRHHHHHYYPPHHHRHHYYPPYHRHFHRFYPYNHVVIWNPPVCVNCGIYPPPPVVYPYVPVFPSTVVVNF